MKNFLNFLKPGIYLNFFNKRKNSQKLKTVNNEAYDLILILKDVKVGSKDENNTSLIDKFGTSLSIPNEIMVRGSWFVRKPNKININIQEL